MKKWLAVLMVLTLCLFTVSALAESSNTTAQADNASIVTALGSATITITPDSATFTAGVSTTDVKVSAAQTANNKAMNKVLEALKAGGVDEADLQTENYSVNPNYDYSSSDTTTPTGYTVSNSVTVTVRDLNNLGKLLDVATSAGANNTYGVTFLSSQTATAYDQALTTAVQEALRKAGVMAKALDRETSNVITITENTDSYVTPLYSKAAGMDAGSSVPIENGQLSVTANVTVVMNLK